jgi:outer membrane protein TolC
MLLRTITVAILIGAGAFAQMTSFPKPGYFRETFLKAKTRVKLNDPVHLNDFVVDGKLELSLKNFLTLVMANNTDIALQLLSVEMPKNAITRAFGSFDPLARASFSVTRTVAESTNALDGTSNGTLTSISEPATFSFAQTLDTGTQYSVTYFAQRSTTSSSYATFNPALASSLSVNVAQPLLRNRGKDINLLQVTIARSRLVVADLNLRAQLLTIINTAENAYWDVVSARENLKVAIGARDVAAEFLKLSERQLELGALSPLDIYNPQQQLATNELSVSQARFSLEQREDVLRKQIGVDLDPVARALPLVLTETVESASGSSEIDREQAIRRAMANRPDLKSAVQNLDLDELNIRSVRNELLPNLTINGIYTTQGVGGQFIPASGIPLPGGYGDALSQMFGFGYPQYGFGLNLTLPIKSRSAAADWADALVAKKRDALNVRTTEEAVRLDILNAISNVAGSQEQLKLAKLARDFAVKNLDAENQKYQLGTEINQNVILAQNALVQAESNVVVNQIGLRRNLLNLLTKTGELLDERGIAIQP